jgi:hypothetical protein
LIEKINKERSYGKILIKTLKYFGLCLKKKAIRAGGCYQGKKKAPAVGGGLQMIIVNMIR